MDHTKIVNDLGAFPLPLEVIPYGSQQLIKLLETRSYQPAFRKTQNGEFFVTDSGNYIIDLHMDRIEEPHNLADWLDHQTGIVEHGLFLDCVNTVMIGTEQGIEIKNVR